MENYEGENLIYTLEIWKTMKVKIVIYTLEIWKTMNEIWKIS